MTSWSTIPALLMQSRFLVLALNLYQDGLVSFLKSIRCPQRWKRMLTCGLGPDHLSFLVLEFKWTSYSNELRCLKTEQSGKKDNSH